MPIVGFHLNKVSIEKKKIPEGNMNVDINVNITNVEEEKDVEIGLAKDRVALKYNFDFKIDYTPEIATVTFKGHVLAVEDEKTAKEIIKDFKKGTFDEDIDMKLKNFIWVKCTAKAFSLEEDVGLPPHVPLPKLAKQPQQQQGFVG